MLRLLCLVLAASLFTTTSLAQAAPFPSAAAPIAAPVRSWAALQAAYTNRHSKMYIYTQSRPGKPQNCHISTITSVSITCRHMGRAKIFARADIDVINIENPAERGVGTAAWSLLAASSASAYGAYALGSVLAASIPLAILAFALLCVIGAIEVGDNYESTRIYQRP